MAAEIVAHWSSGESVAARKDSWKVLVGSRPSGGARLLLQEQFDEALYVEVIGAAAKAGDTVVSSSIAYSCYWSREAWHTVERKQNI